MQEKEIPFLGICYGMQLAVVEFVKNVLGKKDANSVELDPKTKMPIFVYTKKNDVKNKEMRLGLHECLIKKDTLAKAIYKQTVINERNRHLYEFDNKYLELFENTDLVVSGINPHDKAIQIIELKDHPFFLGVQFRPEFLSRPYRAHPVFKEFIKNAINKNNQ